jgi:hypothetical protein
MRFPDICRALDCTEYNVGKNFPGTEVKNVTAGDLMSEVLVYDLEDLLLVTSLNSEQVLRTADMVDAVGIVLVNGKIPSDAMRKLAEEQNLVLLSSPMSMFNACAILHSLLKESRGGA